MKKSLFSLISIALVGYLIVGFVLPASHQIAAKDIQHNLLTKEGKPTPALLEMLQVFNVQHDGTLSSIVDATQKAWLRPKDKERWQVEDILKDKTEKVIPLLEQLGCTQEIVPQRNAYTYGVVLGALATTMQARLSYLLKLWKSGVKIDEIVFLLGERSRDSSRESDEILLQSKQLPLKKDWHYEGKIPSSESELMRFIYHTADLPEDFAQIPATFICTPNTEKGRATTIDTVKQWLLQKPKPGTALVVSSQPYVGYQDSVVRTAMPPQYVVETVGPQANPDDRITTYVDTVARWLYQEQKRRSTSCSGVQ